MQIREGLQTVTHISLAEHRFCMSLTQGERLKIRDLALQGFSQKICRLLKVHRNTVARWANRSPQEIIEPQKSNQAENAYSAKKKRTNLITFSRNMFKLERSD